MTLFLEVSARSQARVFLQTSMFMKVNARFRVIAQKIFLPILVPDGRVFNRTRYAGHWLFCVHMMKVSACLQDFFCL